LLFADLMQAFPVLARNSAAFASLEFSGVTADSRTVSPGDLFVAIPGKQYDGCSFIADAVQRGAAAVLVPEGAEWPVGVPIRPSLQDREPRRRLAEIAAFLAGPQPAMIAAVTGTNGKTSTVEFLRQIWSLGGKRAASLGTLGLAAPGFELESGLTTPDPVALAAILARLARAGIGQAAIEASSHGLDQFRLDGVRLTAAAFTSFSRDHLDYHRTDAAYRQAKLRLFSELLPRGAPAIASSALDVTTCDALRDLARERGLEFATVGETGTLIRLLEVHPCPEGQTVEVAYAGARCNLLLPLPGRFQADNALLAAALAIVLGETDPLARLPLLVGVRGRMELAARLPNGAAVYVDYAHTPDALERLLTALRPHTSGRLHVVLGAGGDRDRGKRPLMGAAALRLADRVIVTDDNPRTENPAVIRAEILSGCPGALEMGDRLAAIEAGLHELKPGDVLAVAGKGHEQGQTIGAETIPFDDVTVVRSLVGRA
jgi:UDP-N-acetylmuramoyl-L-alanyl-D-glutamate--2,6-diaminopimelate ligase